MRGVEERSKPNASPGACKPAPLLGITALLIFIADPEFGFRRWRGR